MSWRWSAEGPDRVRPRPPVGIGVAVAALLQLPGLGFAARVGRHGHGHERIEVVAVVAVLLGIAAALALIFRRTHPGPVVVAAGVLSAASLALTEGPPLAAIPFAIAVVAGIARGARIWVWSTLAGVALLVPTLSFAATGSPVSSIRPLVLALALCFLVGLAELFRARRERYREQARQAIARQREAEEAERVRIARELHDVLAHSLSQISVQAGVGLHLFDSDPAQARSSLEAVRATSVEALAEVRGVLSFLRGGTEAAERIPAPDLARLPALAEAARTPQTAIDLVVDLAATPSSAVQLALYRIVQESLTNAARHAAPTTISVRVADDAGGVRVRVVDDGVVADPAAPGATASQGRGIVGMRERAELLGGALTAGPGDTAGFVVDAWIPLTPGTGGPR